MNIDTVGLIVQQLKSTGQLGAILAHPAVQEVLTQSHAAPEPSKPSAGDLTEDEIFFMNAFRGFLATEAGSPYVGMASKFARYVQGTVDKAKA